jgi:hypothetical protein
MAELLLLRAETPDDLIILSACVQDMVVKLADIAWQPGQRRLVLLGNRFRWEDMARGPKTGTVSRVRSGLRFDFVERVQRRNWPTQRDAVLPLLAVTFEDGGLVLSFGGGAMLRLWQEVLDVTLEDVSGPWGAAGVPDHDAG